MIGSRFTAKAGRDLLSALGRSLAACAAGTLTSSALIAAWACARVKPAMAPADVTRAIVFSVIVVAPIAFLLALPLGLSVGTPVVLALQRRASRSRIVAAVSGGGVLGVAYSWLLSRSAPADLAIGAFFGYVTALFHVFVAAQRRT